MRTHTAGPWGLIVNVNHWSVQTASHHIAGGTGWGIPNLHAEMVGNARLCAAAPETLEALRVLLSWMPTVQTFDRLGIESAGPVRAIAGARAAIALVANGRPA